MHAVVALLMGVAGVVLSAVLTGVLLGTVTFFLVGFAAPVAFMAGWTWSQHAVAAALVTLYGAMAFSKAKGGA